MSLLSVIFAYFAAMLMAGNIRTKWLAFAACPVAAVGITLFQGLLAWGFTGEALGAPLAMAQFTIMNTLFMVIFLAFGYWRVSRQKAQSEDHSSSCSTAQSGPR